MRAQTVTVNVSDNQMRELLGIKKYDNMVEPH